ncbi:MAG: hypothetical protein ACI849_000130 [Patiriisocius sp.]|jgi:hypothetical protein
MQVVWDQDFKESRIDAPGNFYSKKQVITVNKTLEVKVVLSEIIPERIITAHPLAKEVVIASALLSKWRKTPIQVKASVILPHNYNKNKQYPIRYNVAGYGGRYTRINNKITDKKFMEWWDSPEAPQIINVFLDGEGPFGDSYQMDSENSGPTGNHC